MQAIQAGASTSASEHTAAHPAITAAQAATSTGLHF